MARKPRVPVAGGWYHVVNRGNRREDVFRTDTDRRRFLGRLAELPGRFRTQVHAFVLMDNPTLFCSGPSTRIPGVPGGCIQARSQRRRLEPMKKIARMLRAHEELLLNWLRGRGEISNGPVEGLNSKIRLVTRRSYGFRTYRGMELALYHNLSRLPEPPVAHRFC